MPADTRDMILSVLRRKTGAATTPRNMANWFGRSRDEVKAELARLQKEGIAEPLPTYRGRARIWVLSETGETENQSAQTAAVREDGAHA